MADHLMAVFQGHIRYLMINIPPRHMKSLSCGVFFPAWAWVHEPAIQFLSASYAHNLAVRDSVKTRRLIQSEEYQALIRQITADGTPFFELTSDQNTKIRYENNRGGYRLATSIGGVATGEGGDIITVDDPHNIMEGESDIKRQTCCRWWDESLSTRLNDPNTGAYVLIGQRSHHQDLFGHVLENEGDDDWCIIKLPAEYKKSSIIKSPLDVKDPRTKPNELLMPGRFTKKTMATWKKKLGSYGTAAQLDQEPTPREGGMFKVENIKQIHEFDRTKIEKSARYWDKAATEGGGCYTAGVLMHRMKDGSYVIENIRQGQWSYGKRNKIIKAVAQADEAKGYDGLTIWLEQEPGSGGKESAEFSIKDLAGFKVKADKVSGQGDKVRRAEPFAIQVEAGNVYVLIRDWTGDFIDQLHDFPLSDYKDMVDASAGAFNKIALGKKVLDGTW